MLCLLLTERLQRSKMYRRVILARLFGAWGGLGIRFCGRVRRNAREMDEFLQKLKAADSSELGLPVALATG
jgi:hypothetical protein